LGEDGKNGYSEGFKGVENEEGDLEVSDGVFEEVKVTGKGEGTVSELDSVRVEAFDGVEEEDVAWVGSGGLELRFDGVAGVMVWSDEQGVALLAWGAIGKGVSAGEAGGKVDGEEGGAAVGVAVEESDGPAGDAVLPESGEVLSWDVREAGLGPGKEKLW